MQSFLTDRYQRVNINDSYSLWCLNKYVVPEGSFLVPILFNIYLSYMFFLVDRVDIICYAYDNSHILLEETNIKLKTI